MSPLWSWPGKRQGAWIRRSGSQCLLTAFSFTRPAGLPRKEDKIMQGKIMSSRSLWVSKMILLWSAATCRRFGVGPGSGRQRGSAAVDRSVSLPLFLSRRPAGLPRKEDKIMQGKIMSSRSLWISDHDSVSECGDLSPLWSWPGKRQGAWTRRSGSQCILTAFSFTRPAGLPRREDKIMQGKIMSSRSLWISIMILFRSAVTCHRFGVGPEAAGSVDPPQWIAVHPHRFFFHVPGRASSKERQNHAG